MADTLLPPFKQFRQEAAVIGRLLAGYGELEYELTLCVGEIIGNDDLAKRVLYRIRGELPRQQIADALIAGQFKKSSLDLYYYKTVAPALELCRQIRNQFAHAHWKVSADGNCLCFADPDKAAKSGRNYSPNFQPITLKLLKQQEAYFLFAVKALRYLRAENQLQAGKISSHAFPKPRARAQPPRYS